MEVSNDSFNSENFADYAKSEAEKYLPYNMKISDKEFILKMFRESALRTGNVLSQDQSLNLENKQEIFIRAKYILEWVFKVAVALAESNIPIECRRGFILDIGFITFEVSRTLDCIPDITDEQMNSTIEYQVMCKVKSILAELQHNGIIGEQDKENFLNHPYMDKSCKNIEFAIYG